MGEHVEVEWRNQWYRAQVLASRGADLGKVMIGHSNETTDLGYLEQLIDNGSYIGWDRCGLHLTVLYRELTKIWGIYLPPSITTAFQARMPREVAGPWAAASMP